MAYSSTCPDIDGASELRDWFDDWPSFHDAEVLEIFLSVEKPSRIRVRTWKVSIAVDPAGHSTRTKQAIVSFELRGLFGMELFEFGHQNVLGALLLTSVDGGHRIEFEQLHGVGGWIAASEVTVSFTPESK